MNLKVILDDIIHNSETWKIFLCLINLVNHAKPTYSEAIKMVTMKKVNKKKHLGIL